MTSSISKKLSQGFALLEVFLALLLISLISFGSYAMITHYRTVSLVQPFERDAMNIFMTYAPIQNATAFDIQPAMINASHEISVAFLRSVPVLEQNIVNPAPPVVGGSYSYLYTNLTVEDKKSVAGFAQIATDGLNNVPVIQYFVIGFSATCGQLTQLIQDNNTGVGLFYGDKGVSLTKATLGNALPSCSDKSRPYSVYFVSPKTDVVTNFKTDFTAPDPQ